jgi:glutamyl-tRNA(Gln) amidotransferase subunit E
MDYAKLGLKCGVEIHQQLDTRKLFCDCQSSLDSQARGEIVRRLRAVAGELGDVDTAALHEVLMGREFRYRLYPGESCLVEQDEEPPHNLNTDALDIALTIAVMLGCDVPDEIHVMRKQVIDGSNTTGFQRTAMVGLNGKLGTPSGDVGITNLSLEEDAAQILGKEHGSVIYGLNRLCIPLVEIGTTSNIRSPEHAREVAARLGMILRSTGRAKRGLGTIRQDINVSIRDGARVEIKGAQNLNLVPRYVENEAQRQVNLVKIRDKLKKSGFKPPRPVLRDASRIFGRAQSRITRGKPTFSMRIPGFAGFLKTQLTPTRTLGNEIAGYMRVRTGSRGFIHSDEVLEKYGLEEHFRELEKHHKAGPKDTLIIVSGDRALARKTFQAITERIEQLLGGVPEETRRALENGDTEFMRPLPGAARLYPETDIPPVFITPAKMREIRKNLPELIEQRVVRFMGRYRINEELASQVVHSGFSEQFEYGVGSGLEPTFVASLLTSGLTQLKRKEAVPVENLTDSEFRKLFDYLKKRRLPRERVLELLRELATRPDTPLADLLREEGLSERDLTRIIRRVVSRNRGALRKPRPEKILMGDVMKEVRGKASGQLVMRLLLREIRKA